MATSCWRFLSGCLALSLSLTAQARCAASPELAPWGVATSKPSSTDLPRWIKGLSDRGVHALRAEAMLMVHKQQYPAFTSLDRMGILQTQVAGSFPDQPAWVSYVTDMLQRAATKGKVFDWEVWNEPPNQSLDKSPVSYAALVRSTSATAKAIHPLNRVGLSTASANLQWIDRTIQGGAAGAFDFVTLHPYEMVAKLDQGFEAVYMSLAPNLGRVMAANGQAPVPIVLSEVGLRTAANAQARVNALVKTHVLGLAQGLARIHWYEGADQPMTPATANVTEGWGLQHRVLAANSQWTLSFSADDSLLWLSRLITTLGERPVYRGLVLLDGRHLGFVFLGTQGVYQGQVVVVAWTDPDGADQDLAFSDPVQQIDGVTGTARWVSQWRLSPAPTLLVAAPTPGSQGQAWLDAADAQCGQPFPWGGDYRAQSLVSMRPSTAWRHLNEQGLHPLTPSYRQDEQGQWVMDPSANGMPVQKFAVDPNFMPWSRSSPALVLSAELRRRPGTTLPVQLHLEFESRRGLNSRPPGGVVTLADDAWHTVQWTLPDPAFAGAWGYHFALVLDVLPGMTASTPDYLVHSVSARKQAP